MNSCSALLCCSAKIFVASPPYHSLVEIESKHNQRNYLSLYSSSIMTITSLALLETVSKLLYPSASDPPSVADLSPCFLYAVLITFLRYYLIEVIFTYLGCKFMNLPPYSIQQYNSKQQYNKGNPIPSQVLKLFHSYSSLQAQYSAAKKKAKLAATAVILKKKLNTEYDKLVNILSSSPYNSSSSQISQWFQLIQHDAVRSSKLKKFNEAGWRFSFYLFIWLFGFVVLFDKPWFRVSIHEVWRNYPFQTPDVDIQFYYLLSLGHYIHLCVSQFTDVKRKDFW
jgi:hypothetical protein